MDTLQLLGLVVGLVMLYFCAVLLSSDRSRSLGHQIWKLFHAHAEGLDAYRATSKAVKKNHEEVLAEYEQNREKKQKEAALRKAAVRAAQQQFERSITQ